jgi:hypothetical protein
MSRYMPSREGRGRRAQAADTRSLPDPMAPRRRSAAGQARAGLPRVEAEMCLGIPSHAVGTVPPSITYSVPEMEAARGDTKKAIRSATSRGFAGRPIGMPPRDAINACRALS